MCRIDPTTLQLIGEICTCRYASTSATSIVNKQVPLSMAVVNVEHLHKCLGLVHGNSKNEISQTVESKKVQMGMERTM